MAFLFIFIVSFALALVFVSLAVKLSIYILNYEDEYDGYDDEKGENNE